MTQDPTPYDLLQDAAIEGLQEIVTPYYQPPSEVEHSFPVTGQGINSRQYQQMSLAQGDGLLITDGSESPYLLTGLAGGDAATNAQNQMLLKVSPNTGRAEAILGGFYHVLYEDMIIDLPPVSTATTYYVTLTLDPREEEQPNGPVSVKVHAGDLPRTHGRRHIILHTIHRQPNQLLTQADHMLHRQYVSPAVTVSRGKGGLPDPSDVLYGTLGVTRNVVSGGAPVPGTGGLYESRGIHGWHNLLETEWVTLSPQNAWELVGGETTIKAKHQLGIVHLQGRVRNGQTTRSIAVLPPPLRPQRTMYVRASVTPVSAASNIQIDSGGVIRLASTGGSYSWISLDGLSFPLD